MTMISTCDLYYKKISYDVLVCWIGCLAIVPYQLTCCACWATSFQERRSLWCCQYYLSRFYFHYLSKKLISFLLINWYFHFVVVFWQVRDVFLPWYNAYRFLVQNAKRVEVEGLAPFVPFDQATLLNSTNVLDQWINSATQSLIHFVRQEMDGYRLYTVSSASAGLFLLDRKCLDRTRNINIISGVIFLSHCFYI